MKSVLLTLSIAALVAGCGGGGGDSGIPTGTSYAVNSANHLLLTTANSWTVSGRGSDARIYTATISTAPLSPGVFPLTGATTARVSQSITFSAPGGVSQTTTTTGYFDSSSDFLAGSVDAGGNCSRVDSNTPLPASASVGARGALYSETDLATCSASAASVGTSVVTWSLEAAAPTGGGAAFALLCQNAVVTDLVTSANSGTTSLCFEVTTSGAIGTRGRLGVSIPALPFTLVATNY